MTLLELLVHTDHPAIDDLIAPYGVEVEPELAQGKFDNRPTWDNWSKTTGNPFDNRPTWDNWNKTK